LRLKTGAVSGYFGAEDTGGPALDGFLGYMRFEHRHRFLFGRG
jgi:hypothetical protein